MTRDWRRSVLLTAAVAVALPLGGADRDGRPAEGLDAFVARARREHWAFQPLAEVSPPAVARPERARGALDRFILAQLDAAGLELAPEADRGTLIRRLGFDLLGLPPEPAAVDAFVADSAPDAYERLVDRLLASPRYGERWGRHWLDVARYADTKGYVFTQEPRYPYSYTYRDYVVRSFNEDLPYDRFILEQVAADRLELGEDRRALAALGFLTLGRRFSNNVHDIRDDRIDVVTRGLLGLTVTCARCHDHKYDPISTEEYYGLYGIFASSEEPDDPPLIGDPDPSPELDEFLARRRELAAEVDAYMAERHRELVEGLRGRAADYLLAATRGVSPADGEELRSYRAERLKPALLERWQAFLARSKEGGDALLAPWHALAALPAERFAAEAVALISGWREDAPANARVVAALATAPPTSLDEAAKRYGEVFAAALAAMGEARALEKETLDDPALESARRFLFDEEGPCGLPVEEARRYVNRAVRDKLRQLDNKVAALEVSHAGAPPRAMVLQDVDAPQDARVFVRGNPARPGDVAPRQFLAVVREPGREPFRDGSGRLELARALVDDGHALVARVIVNRVWQHLFGAGLVRTSSDFGYRGTPPTHPDLLDWLAARFIEDGWSIKRLHRRILLSATYRQRSDVGGAGEATDPENALLWRMRRKRLEFEALRDAMLAVTGSLDTRMGGRSVDIVSAPFSRRRALYGVVDRQNLPGLMRSFDFASPDASCPQRHETTVPQQALFLMNGAFALERARRLVGSTDAISSDEARLAALYGLVYGRAPTVDEVELGLRFVREAADADTGWTRAAHALFMSNEFVFVD